MIVEVGDCAARSRQKAIGCSARNAEPSALLEEEQSHGRPRGGTVSTWWWGWKDSDLPCAENVFELTTAPRRRDWAKAHPPANWEDPSKQVRLGAGVEGPAPVGSYLPNPFGLLDMGGNVSEWCADVRNPLLRHARGGSIMFGASGSRSAARLRAPKGFIDPALGLRFVRGIDRGR